MTRIARFLAAVTIFACQVFVLAQAPANPPPDDPLAISRKDRLEVFEKLWAAVRDRYRASIEAARDKAQLESILQEMLDELGSSHLVVRLRAKIDATRIEQDLLRKPKRGESYRFDPGVSFTRVGDRRVVSAVAAGSGAGLAGVQRGWTATDGPRTPDRHDRSAVCDLGGTINLSFRDLDGRDRTLAITCRLYAVAPAGPERATRTLPGGAAYLRLTSFSHGAESWLAGQLKNFHDAPAIVIDLRGNGGGLLSVVKNCLRPFFRDPTVLGEFRERGGKEPTLRIPGAGRGAYAGRVIVLTDEGTMSAAEIFAAGMQESGRGTIVGRQSGGQVLASIVRDLPKGFSVRIAIRDYHTARGVRLEQRGVTPDESVALTMSDFMAGHDPDLERVTAMLKMSGDVLGFTPSQHR